jgi:CBS domain containing-hemolysin-like protein
MNADRNPDVVFRSTLYLMDIERVRFALSRYLRSRVRKIEDQLDFVAASPEVAGRLSPQERELVQRLLDLNSRYIDGAVTSRLRDARSVSLMDGDDLYLHSVPAQQVAD